jgi:Tfp pilus assembly protein PilX
MPAMPFSRTRRKPAPAAARQRGATLVIALLVLVLIMMVGITAVSTSNTQLRLAGNLQFEDAALNNAESAVTAAEQWLSTGTNFRNAGFTTFNAGASPQLKPVNYVAGLAAPSNSPLTMAWADTNSLAVGGNAAQRYYIELMSRNNRLLGSSQVVGGRSSSGCNQVDTFLITARGISARSATKFVQSYYSVLSCVN